MRFYFPLTALFFFTCCAPLDCLASPAGYDTFGDESPETKRQESASFWNSMKERISQGAAGYTLAPRIEKFSTAIQEKKKAADGAVWAYLKEVDKVAASKDAALREEIEKLKEDRINKLKALSDEVIRVVNEESSKAEKLLSPDALVSATTALEEKMQDGVEDLARVVHDN